MAKSCVIKPSVMVNGEVQQSKLYDQIYDYLGKSYKDSWNVYLSIIHSDKVKEAISQKLISVNKQGEPKIDDLLQKFHFDTIVNSDKVISIIDKKFDFKEPLDIDMQNQHTLEQKCNEINDSMYGNQYNATISKKGKSMAVEVKPKDDTDESSELKRAIRRSNSVNSIIIEQLKKWGIGIDVLEDYENYLANGEIDFTVSDKAADGLIHMIRIAKGELGQEALPEEFSHLVIRALRDNVAVQRCLNYIKSHKLVEEILGNKYQQYVDEYADEDLVAEEALGKMLSTHIHNNAKQLVQNERSNAIIKDLLQKIWEYAKRLFSRFNENDIITSRQVLDNTLNVIAKKALTEDIDVSKAMDATARKMYQFNETTKKRLESIRQLTENIIKNEVKRYKIERNRSTNNANEIAQTIRLLVNSTRANSEMNAITTFIVNAISDLTVLTNKLNTLNNANADISTKASILRSLRNAAYSYNNILNEIRAVMLEENRYADSRFNQELIDNINKAQLLVGNMLANANLQGKKVFIEFIRPVLGDKVIDPHTKQEYTLDDLINMKVDDMSFMDRWLNSAGESSSFILKAFDQSYKEQKDNARRKTQKLYKRLAERTQKLRDAGYTDQSFMFELDEHGNKSGYYVSEIDNGAYNRAKTDFHNQLLQILGHSPSFAENEWIAQYMRDWVANNTDSISGEPRLDLYESKQWKTLNKTQRDYINDIIQIKQSLDSNLRPNATELYRTIKIEKDLLERVKTSDGVRNGTKMIWESLKDNVVVRTDDTDAGIASTIQDFEGHEVKDLPIFYTQKRDGRSENDMSEDIVSTMTAYASMSYEYFEVGKVLDAMEVGRNVIRDAGNPYTTPARQEFLSGAGAEFTDQMRKADTNNILSRINDFFDMQIYHKYMADAEDTIGSTKISKGKAANASNTYTSLCQMAFNLLSGISNVNTGNIQMHIEAIGGQFFKYKDMAFADKEFMAHCLPSYLGDVGSRYPQSKLALFDEKFNVMQDFEGTYTHMDYDRGKFSKLFRMDSVFFLNNIGEFWMQNRTAIALAHSDKEALTDASGNKVSVWDAYEAQMLGSDVSSGSTLKLRDGLKYKDGRVIITEEELERRAAEQDKDVTDKSLLNDNEMSEYEFVHKLSRKMAKLNHDMHGIYNKDDMNAFQKNGIGRMVMMYRKWIVPSINRRYRKVTYSYDLDSVQEGYYRTAFRFLNRIRKDIVAHQFSYTALKDSMEDYEKANLRKAMTEVATFIAILVAISMIDAFGDDDDDDNYIMNLAEYQLRRLKTEIGALVPTHMILKEGFRILQSPTANLNTWTRITNLIDLITPFGDNGSFNDVIESGRYEGHTKFYKSFMEILPFNRTIYRAIHPEDATKFFTQSVF